MADRYRPMVLLCSLALGAVLPAGARTGRVPEVVYVGVDAGDEAAAQATALARAVSPQWAFGDPAHLASVLGSGELGSWNLDSAAICDGDPVGRAAYREGLDALERAYQMVESTTEPADRLQAMWGCLDAPVTPEDLAQVPFYRGLGAAADGRWDEARAAFREVLSLDRSRAWDGGLEPRAKVCFADAKLELSEQPRQPLRVLAADGSAVWIDGVNLEDPWEGVVVSAGPHLVQVRVTPDGPLTGVVVTTRAEGEGLVTVRAALDPGDPPAPDFRVRMIAVVESMATSPDGSPAVQVLLGTESAVVRADGVELGQPTGPDRIRVGGGLLLGVGAGMAGVGAALAGSAWNEHETLTADAAAGQMVTDEWAAGRVRYNVGWGLLATGAVAAAVGLPMVIVGSPEEKPRTTVTLVPGPTGLGLHGRF